MTTATAGQVFVRDRLTGMAYGGLAVYAYLLYALGPLLPLLRQDLRVGYTVMSLHSTAFAAGAVLTNLLFERLRGRAGHRRLYWVAAGGLALGSVLLAAGSTVAVTLTAAVVGGISGSLLQTTALAALAEHHGRLRERALVEANAGASATALVAPLAIGVLQGAGAAWNWSLLLPPAAVAVMYVLFRREPLRPRSPADDAPGGATGPGGRLPAVFWIRGALCGVVVGAEFCLVFYGSPQLTGAVGLTTGQAGAAMGLFYAGELIGRLAGSRLTGAAGRPVPRLVLGALAVGGAGFLLLWTAGSAWTALAGLFVAGLGIANLFPLTLSLAVGAAPGRTGRATAHVQLLVGTAIMIAPLLLGSLSDRIGVRLAFGVAGLLLLLALVLLRLGTGSTPGTVPAPRAAAPHAEPQGVTEPC
ncbi:sugar MFS transporter [Kitasatospora sp. NBC_00315]|uniref:MFS transporter n=1 Tax=Kitasatospora sp. NBC_00315 TaxID=2975963 RepID=UPI0032462FCD